MNRFRSLAAAAGLLAVAGCGGGRSPEAATTAGPTPQYEGASPREIDSLYRLGEGYVRHGEWSDALAEARSSSGAPTSARTSASARR